MSQEQGSEGTSKRAAHNAGSLVSPWPADAIEVIEAALERIESLELELAAVKGWRIMGALERGLDLEYRVPRNEWAVLDGSSDPMTRRTLPEAIALALQLRDHRVAIAAQLSLQKTEAAETPYTARSPAPALHPVPTREKPLRG